MSAKKRTCKLRLSLPKIHEHLFHSRNANDEVEALRAVDLNLELWCALTCRGQASLACLAAATTPKPIMTSRQTYNASWTIAILSYAITMYVWGDERNSWYIIDFSRELLIECWVEVNVASLADIRAVGFPQPWALQHIIHIHSLI